MSLPMYVFLTLVHLPQEFSAENSDKKRGENIHTDSTHSRKKDREHNRTTFLETPDIKKNQDWDLRSPN